MRNVPRPLLILALALLGSLAGCNFIELPEHEPPMAPPVMPIPDGADQAIAWYLDWANEPDITNGGGVREMLALFGSRGRSWRGTPGPSGYAVRLVLLDENDKPMRVDGPIRAVLVANPEQPGARPLMAWALSAEESAARFRKGRLPGYLLQLDWGPRAPRTGDYMLIFRWTDPSGQERLTRNIVFQDITRYEPPTYLPQ